MNAQLDDAAGVILRRSVENIGITVHTEKRTTRVLSEGGSITGIAFADGTEVACDMLVVSAGIRPNVGLAQRAGLTVERAIVVDDHMRSIDDDDIYVVGECAQHRGQVYGLVAPLWEQAAVLADHLTGTDHRAAYHGSRMATKLKVAGVDVAAMGFEGARARRRRIRPVLRTQTRHLQEPSWFVTANSSAPPWSATSARSRS